MCRVAIIGLGFGEAVLAPAFRHDPRVRLVGACGSSAETARASAERLGLATSWDDWRAAIADEGVDAVAVAVPPVLQPAIIREAAKRGKHVFCEKPLGVSREAIEGLLEAVTSAGIAHAVDFELAELASFRAARAYRQGSQSWRHFALTWRVESRANRLGGHPWKTSSARGGGALLNFASHVVHGLEWMLGRIERVMARLGPAGGDAESRVDAWVELADGISGTISIATDAPAGSGFRLELYGSDEMMLLENQSADHLRNYVLSTRNREGGARVTLVDERSRPNEPPPSTDGRIEPVASLVKRFVDASLAGRSRAPVRPGLEEGVRVATVLDAMRAAHASGAWQETP